MTKYRIEVRYNTGTFIDGWYWRLFQADENRYVFVDSSNTFYTFRWTAILGGKHAARKCERDKKRKTPYTKEFTI